MTYCNEYGIVFIMIPLLIRNQFVGMHELRKSLPRLLTELRKEGTEVVITRQGKPAAVILDIERYLEVQEALREFSDPDYLAALLKAREDIRQGKGIAASEVFRRKGI